MIGRVFAGKQVGAKVPDDLALAKTNARAARLAANRAMSCERCLGQQASLPVHRAREGDGNPFRALSGFPSPMASPPLFFAPQIACWQVIVGEPVVVNDAG